MIGAVSQYGKLGLTVIGNHPAQVDAIYDRTIAVLDRETEYGRRPARASEELPPAHEPERPSATREYRDTIAVPRVWRDQS